MSAPADVQAAWKAMQNHPDRNVQAWGRLAEKLYPVIEEWWDSPATKDLAFLCADRVYIQVVANAYACCIVDAVKPGGADGVIDHAVDHFREMLERSLKHHRDGGPL